MAIQLARHAEAEVCATASAMKQDCVHGLSAVLIWFLNKSFQRRIPHSWGRRVHKTFVPIRYFLYSDRYQLRQVSVLIDHGVIKPHIDRCFSLEKMPTSILIVNGGMVGGNLL